MSQKQTKKVASFRSFGFSPPVLKAIAHRGYRHPTPIQKKTIPLVLNGCDVVAMARTGSGKTAVFLLPLLEKLQRHDAAASGPRALILTPTRELALQTSRFMSELGKYTNIKTAVIVGGDNIQDDFALMHSKPDVIVATPGRLLHILVEMEINHLHSVSYFVIDECDRMFELGFRDQLDEIIRRITLTGSNGVNRQTILTSATLPGQVAEFARAGLTAPKLVRLDIEQQLSQKLDLQFVHCNSSSKLSALILLVRAELNNIGPSSQCVVFCATRHHCDLIDEIFKRITTGSEMDVYSSVVIYSNLDPSARKINMAKFRAKRARVLIVTDLAARGLDIPQLDLVINMHFPATPKLFVHRVGRVARAGCSGRSISLVTNEELAYCVQLYEFLSTRTLLPLFADVSKTNSSREKETIVDGVLGRVPQSLLDFHHERIDALSKDDVEIEEKFRSSVLSYKKYLRCCPAPECHVVPKAKLLIEACRTRGLSIHPLFQKLVEEHNGTDNVAMDDENNRASLLNQLSSYKPRGTIFDIGVQKKSTSHAVMQRKRKLHAGVVESTRKSTEKDVCSMINGLHDAKKRGGDIIDDENEVDLSVNSAIPTRKSKPGDASPASKDNQSYFLPYRPKNWSSEGHLRVNKLSSDSSFANDVHNSAFSVPGDECGVMENRTNQIKKWDRDRKKFASKEKFGKVEKMIRTEGGRKISASYKTDLYKKWRKRNLESVNATNQFDENEEDESRLTKKRNVLFCGAINSTKDFRRKKTGPKGTGKKGKNSAVSAKSTSKYRDGKLTDAGTKRLETVAQDRIAERKRQYLNSRKKGKGRGRGKRGR